MNTTWTTYRKPGPDLYSTIICAVQKRVTIESKDECDGLDERDGIMTCNFFEKMYKCTNVIKNLSNKKNIRIFKCIIV
jgi:hypothetical protein